MIVYECPETLREIHEWCYLNYNKFKYVSFCEFLNIAKSIFNSCVLSTYHDWVIKNIYLFPWQDQSEIHRIGYFSWERVNIKQCIE